MEDVELIVTSITELTKKRRLICINFEPAFALYNSEISDLKLEENKMVSHELYRYILENILNKRCIIRAMELLKARDYTVKELIDKLKGGYYPGETVDKAIVYVSNYGYLDDERYTENYIRYKSVNKPRKYIEQQLMLKGVSATVIKRKLDEYYLENNDAELKIAVNYLSKKISACDDIGYEEKQKLLGYLYRKGFNTDTIIKALDIVLDNI